MSAPHGYINLPGGPCWDWDFEAGMGYLTINIGHGTRCETPIVTTEELPDGVRIDRCRSCDLTLGFEIQGVVL